MVTPTLTPTVLAYTPPDPPLKEFTPARDRAFFADPKKNSLLSQASAVEEVTPHIGTELKGVQLSSLTDAQKDELALLIAEVHSESWIRTLCWINFLTYVYVERRGLLPGSRYYT